MGATDPLAATGNALAQASVDPHAVVIFGATGDLTRRKLLPAFYHLFMERRLPDRFAIVGAASRLRIRRRQA